MTSESDKWDNFLDAYKQVSDKGIALNQLAEKMIGYIPSKTKRKELSKELEKINGKN